jgi:hypothetical protein
MYTSLTSRIIFRHLAPRVIRQAMLAQEPAGAHCSIMGECHEAFSNRITGVVAVGADSN